MIRQAAAADVVGAQAVLRAAFTPFIAVIGQKPAPLLADLAAAQSAGQLWVAGDKGAVAAMMVCFAKGSDLELDILSVAPAAQGQGLGAQMVAHAEHLARTAGARALTLYTNAAMTGAQRLYARLGFDLVDRRPQDGFDRLFYRKPLSGCAGPTMPASS